MGHFSLESADIFKLKIHHNFYRFMKDSKNEIDNKIWYNFFIRSANEFVFDLVDKGKNLRGFSDEQVYNMVAVCDDILVKAKVFKEELKRRVGSD
jgi:hypothetical protein